MKITPTNGTRRFRRSYMGVEADAVVVGGRKGVSRRFPLHQGPESPAEFVMVMSEPMGAFRSQAVILDGKGEALAISHVGDWDSLELEEFLDTARLTQRAESLSAPMENLRDDGLVLEDGTWFNWVPAAGTLTLVFSLLTGSGYSPPASGG